MDVADIHLLPDNEAGWIIFIEGLAEGFTNIPELAGSGASSYIGTTYGARTIKLGLMLPAELSYGEADPWSSEINDPSPAAITLLDLDESLVSLFIDDEPDETTDGLQARLSPLDDPAPDPGIGLDGELITLWGRHVGIERIGPEGERRYFWICPADAPPGLDHLAAEGWPAVRVTDSPSHWAGRKVAVYRIVRDPDDGTWPNWLDQYEGGSLWWYGTMTDRGEWVDVTSGDEQGRAFRFYALGPSSWTEHVANLSRPTDTWYKPTTGTTLTGDELKVAAWIEPLEPPAVGDGIGDAITLFDVHTLESGDDLTGLVTADDFFAQIRDIVYTMAYGTDHGTVLAADNAQWTGPVLGSAGEWNDGADPELLRRIIISDNGRTIQIKCEATDTARHGFRLCIAADARVWQAAGWDITRSEFFVNQGQAGHCPIGGPDWGESEGDQIMGPYHVIGRFSTRNEKEPGFDTQWDNDGAWRYYTAAYPEGCTTLDKEGGTEVYVATGVVRCEGQHGRPFALGSQIDGVDCDAAGWWIFRGMRLTAAQFDAGETEGTPYVGVALCEWVSTAEGDGVEINNEGEATIRIIRWEHPRMFGLPFDPLDEDWTNVVGTLECAPLGVLGGTAFDAPGWRHRTIVTALLSTGTSLWDDTGPAVTITAGANQPGDFPANDTAGDIEVADLGLGLPAPFVDWQSFYTAASQLTGGIGGALNRVLYVLYGSVKLSTILREAMSGAGWSWSLMRKADGGMLPAFGCYDPLRLVQPGEVVATLTRADMAELGIEDGPQWRGQVELRRGGPYDRFEYEMGGAPIDVDGGEPYEFVQESTDTGRRFRSGKIPWQVKDSGMRDPGPWIGTSKQAVYDWTGHTRDRFASGIGPRLAKQQRIYRAVYNARFAGVLGLGSPVHVVDSTAENPTGTRGINHRGRVIELSIVARGTGNCSVRVAVELERKAVDAVHVWGPCALGGEWDPNRNEVTISEDHFLVGGSHTDAIGWTQPDWSSHAAGDLTVTVYQSEDGATWDPALAFETSVVAVDAIDLTLELSGGGLSAILRDTVKMIVAYGDISALPEWAASIFAPVCASTGLYNGVDKGVRLKSG